LEYLRVGTGWRPLSTITPKYRLHERRGKAAIEGERTNILLLGVDAREGEKHSRADTNILASIDPDLKKSPWSPFPARHPVNIGGSSDKICVANYYGGPSIQKSGGISAGYHRRLLA
jgi:hypothetical protein